MSKEMLKCGQTRCGQIYNFMFQFKKSTHKPMGYHRIQLFPVLNFHQLNFSFGWMMIIESAVHIPKSGWVQVYPVV